MYGSLVIIAKRFLVACNIHIIRLVLNAVSAEAVGVNPIGACLPLLLLVPPRVHSSLEGGGQQGLCWADALQGLPRTEAGQS